MPRTRGNNVQSSALWKTHCHYSMQFTWHLAIHSLQYENTNRYSDRHKHSYGILFPWFSATAQHYTLFTLDWWNSPFFLSSFPIKCIIRQSTSNPRLLLSSSYKRLMTSGNICSILASVRLVCGRSLCANVKRPKYNKNSSPTYHQTSKPSFLDHV